MLGFHLLLGSLLLAPEIFPANTTSGGDRHAPHDNAYSIAVGPLPGGGEEVVIITDEKTVLSSRDNLLSFRQIIGSGLEDHRPTSVSYNPSFPWFQGQGKGLFLIGTDNGRMFLYQPSDPVGQGPISEFSSGLTTGTANDKFIYAIVSPDGYSRGAQPSFLLTKSGKVKRTKKDGTGWETVFDTGSTLALGAIAIAPRFKSNGDGPRSALLVGVNEFLYGSKKGGNPGSWIQVQDLTSIGMRVSALAFDHDFGQTPDARIYLGTNYPVSGFPPDEGHLFTSQDGGQNFVFRHMVHSTIGSIVSTPPGPSKPATVYFTGREHPGANNYFSGVVTSTDRGDSWQDPSSYQCFLMEHDPGHASGHKPLRFFQQLLVLPDYETRGSVLYGRNEGIFLSEDEGSLWREMPMRSPEEARNLQVFVDNNGDEHLFSATYGQGMVIKNLDTGLEYLGDPGMNIVFTVQLATSPNFVQDGASYVCGTPGLVAWFNPTVDPPVNQFGVTGPKKMPLRHITTNRIMDKYVRTVALPPDFHADPNVGSNLIYFGAWDNEMYKSEDGGLTYVEANTTNTGSPLPYINTIAIAPTFDSNLPHSDIYGMGNLGKLMRMTNDVWEEVVDFNKQCNRVLIDPAYDPVSNRKVYVGVDEGAVGVFEIDDVLGSPQVTPLGTGLPPTRVWDIILVEDGLDRWMYIATWSDGIWRCELSGSQIWEQLTMDGFPNTWARSVAVSTDWANNKKVFAGTALGVYEIVDDGQPATWSRLFDGFVYDSREASTVYFAPNGSAPNPSLPWPWVQVYSDSLPGGSFGEDARVATTDGSYLLSRGWAKKVVLHTQAGTPTNNPAGTITMTATNLQNGNVLATVTVDLSTVSASAGPWEIEMDLGISVAKPVEVRIEAALDLGETYTHDGLEYIR